ncbi:MAG: calcium/sodium antiporter [Eubacterium sp.]|nr:calcium/sodium antiporter [Eubacterium sp.]
MFDWIDSGSLLLNLVLLIIGFIALIKGADVFVDGAASLAKRFGVSGVIIGLTVVAMGTSAPELAVSVSAGLSGSNEIAVSNVIGSNLFNLLMVLGICALMKPLPVDPGIKKRDYPICLIGTAVLLFYAATRILFGQKPDLGDKQAISGDITRIGGIVFLLAFVGYLLYTIHVAKKTSEKDEDYTPEPLPKSILFIVLGAACIVIGGDGVVTSAKNLAMMWGMSETLVGLTIVAIGTSLPELVTSIVASRKGENGMAIGNAIGSNIFNLLLILGASSTIRPIPITVASFFDIAILLTISIISYFFVCSGKHINRIEGAAMVMAYAAYTVYAILR